MTPHTSTQPLLTIADVERETGLHKDTLRVWERRYGFPTPTRDKQGNRVYDSEQLQRLRLIKQLLDTGLRPGGVVPLPQNRLQELAADAAPSPIVTGNTSQTEEIQEFLDWLRNGQVSLLRLALKRNILQNGLAQTVGTWIPVLGHAVGEAWQKHSLTVYQEHLFSDVVQSVLREALASVDDHFNASRPPTVLLTTLPNELHGNGLLAAECFFALEKCPRVALGINTPLSDMVEATRQLKIDIIALSVSAHAPGREVLSQLQQLRQLLPEDIELWVGGSSSALKRKRPPAGILLLNQAQDIPAHVSAWRHKHLPLTQ